MSDKLMDKFGFCCGIFMFIVAIMILIYTSDPWTFVFMFLLGLLFFTASALPERKVCNWEQGCEG